MTSSNWGWTDEQVDKLRRLASRGTMFYTEIAQELGMKPAKVRWKARQLGLPKTRDMMPERFGAWNNKHSHLRADVLEYFQTHSFEETAKRFGLTQGELKSCITYAYKDPNLKHIRKATNDHSPWSTEQLKILLQNAGLRNRDWIAARVGRGNRTCIKERMQFLGIASRNLQGLTCSQFIQAFGRRPEFYLQTDCGPDGGKSAMPTRWKIVPWVWLAQEIRERRLKTAPEFQILIETMATFQEWIHEGDALKKMKRTCAQAAREAKT